jgi:DNA-binding PadR family transcriptional regulator
MNVRGVKEIYTMDGSVLRDDGMISSMGNTERSRKVYRFDADGMKKIEREMGQLHRQRGQLEEEVKGLREQASATNVIKMVE